jgi:uncharacterized protein (TIGR02600 family)
MQPRNKKSRSSLTLPLAGTRGNQPLFPTEAGIQNSRKEKGGIEGAALVIVLTFLVVITGLVVAFLSSVTNEATTTSASAAAVTTRSLADAAIQLDIAQIRDATVGFSRNADGSLNTASPVAWASQPGAIRTYDTNAAAVAVYKLYSSTNMVATGGQSPTNDLPSSAGWVSSTALYTDLNAPVVSGGNTNYPIMDPYMTNTSNGCTLVDGFSISNAPLLSGISNAAAMPVVWIYVLKDGTLIRPDSGSGTTATFASASTNPSAVNPIVGRIAFWTDDETCKLNLNTASEGSFWGTPSFSTSEDVSFARYPPSSTEYSRFPGHPASTCLSPVLWSYLGLTNPAIFLSGLSGVAGSGSYNAGSGDTAPKFGSTTVTNFFTNLFNNVTPRYGWSNSSQAGTYSLIGTNLPSKLSTNRLYASIDEFFFAPTNASPTSRIVTPIALNARDVSRMRFFLTAESRAPEVNPFNLPKITIWPVPNTNSTDPVASNKPTITDQTIAFCSTLGTNAYYFNRYDPTSRLNDFTGRNVKVYNYLRNLLNQPVPGFKGAMAANTGIASTSVKWSGKQADQITTDIYDYIRSDINLIDASSLTNANGNITGSFSNSYTKPPSITANTIQLNNGSGQVVPITINNPSGVTTMGMGRFPVLKSAALWFIAREANQPPLMCHPDGRPVVYDSYGNQISTNVGGCSYIVTNIPITVGSATYTNGAMVEVVCAGEALGRVNIMHPWTLPCTKTNIGGINYLTQLMTGGNPIMVTNVVGANNVVYTNNAQMTNLYPIFDFSSTNTGGSPQTATYPIYNSQNQHITNYSSGISFYVSKNGISKFSTNYIPANNVVGNNYYSHPGLLYVPLQDIKTGAFTIPNASIQYNTPLSPHQTAIEMAYVPDLVNVAPGSVGIKPNFTLSVSGLTGCTINGANIVLSKTTLAFTNNNFQTANYLLHDLGFQIVMGSDGGRIPFYTTTPVIVSGETFGFNNSGDIANTINGPDGSVIATANVNFPTANFPTPKLPTYWVTFGFGSYNPPIGYTNLYTNTMLSFSSARGNNYAYDEQQYGLFMPEMALSQSSGDPSFVWYCSGLNHITADTIQAVDLIYGDPRIISVLSNVPSSMYRVNPAYGNSNSITIQCSTNASIIWTDYLRNAHSLRAGMLTLGGGLYGTLLATNRSGSTTLWTNDFKLPPQYEGTIITTPALNAPSVIGPILSAGSTPLSLTNTPNMLISSNTGGYGNFFGRNPSRQWNSAYVNQTNAPVGNYISGNDGHCSLPFASAECDFTATGTAPGSSFYAMWTNGGDFDTGFSFHPDGPYINKVDEGMGAFANWANVGNNPYFSLSATVSGASLFSANRMVPSPVIFGSLPVFDKNWDPANPLSTLTNSSWRTLQFSPNPNALTSAMRDNRAVSAGFNEAGGLITNTIPPDHLLLDFFQMPVVSPYPISDPFSTAGKVNMNYQIAPFSYIKRTSAMRGVLKPVMITAVDDQWSFNYKMRSLTDLSDNHSQRYSDSSNNRTASGVPSYDTFGSNSGQFYFHYPINASNTLTQFDARFATNDLFHSPSEICSLWLYPAQQPKGNGEEVNALSTDANGVAWTWTTTDNTSIKNWWYKNQGTTRKAMTGDNMRERPYNYLYPRLTTKSNTYQIHYRVQTLKQTRTAHSSDWSTWIDPSAGGVSDKILGEQRGSAVIERFIDPSDPTIPDFTTNVSTTSITGTTLDQFYRFRVFNAKQFTP